MENNIMNRRRFLRLGAAAGLGAAFLPIAAKAEIGFGGTVRAADGSYRVTSTKFLMGTFVTISAINESRDRASQAVEAAFGEIQRLSDVFDRHVEGTEMSELNAKGRLTGAHPELAAVVKRSVAMTRETRGAFDATILPVVELVKSGTDVSRIDIAKALSLVDGSAVSVEGRDIRFGKSGMSMTLDGLGKGYIIDRASAAMTALGVSEHMVNAGGDIRVSGDHRWSVAVEDPEGKGAFPAVLELSNCAVATSGGYERSFGDNGYHHVVDPASGMSPAQSVSVSVIAPSAMEADALSTAVFTMPPKRAARFVDALPSRECMVITESGARMSSSRWAAFERA